MRLSMKVRFRLRTALLAFLVLAVALAWPSYVVQRCQREQECARRLRAMGATVTFHYQEESFLLGPAVAPGPRSLRRIFGNEFFARVHTVAFSPPARQPSLGDAARQPASDADFRWTPEDL